MKTEDLVRLAFGVLDCRMAEEGDNLTMLQYATLCGMMVTLAWVQNMLEGKYLQVLLDGLPFAQDITEQEAEAFRVIMKNYAASRN
jgi:hypothetical protein